MTIMSAKGLNVTGVNLKKTKVGDKSQVEDCGRLDTQEDDFDVEKITAIHDASKKGTTDREQVYGTSHNIFDVSSYGEVRMNNVLGKNG